MQAATLQFGNWNGGLQFDVNYAGQGHRHGAAGRRHPLGAGRRARFDPFNLLRDKGPNSLDIRHTFNTQAWSRCRTIANRVLHHIINNNQVSLLVQVNSGTPVQIAGNTDLSDGTNSDRPVGVTRSSITLPGRKNVDARISRFINFGGRYKFEIQAEFKNIFDWEQVSGVQTIRGQRHDRRSDRVAADQQQRADSQQRRTAQVPARLQAVFLRNHAGSEDPASIRSTRLIRSLLSAVAAAVLAAATAARGHAGPRRSTSTRVRPGWASPCVNCRSRARCSHGHPDDENNGVLVALNRGRGLKTSLLTVTRGDGGQNEIGPELFQASASCGRKNWPVHRYGARIMLHARV